MREKPANEAAISRLIDFLNDLWLSCNSELKRSIQVTQMQEKFSVAKRTYSDCKVLGIAKEEADKKLKWIDKNQPSRIMALKILDHRLKKTKKTIHVPIAGLAEVADSLKTIGERLADIYVQNSKLLKTAKNGLKSNDNESDLFRVDDQELYIAGQIASGVFGEAFRFIMNPQDGASFDSTNTFITEATKDLMNKLRNREPINAPAE